MAKEFPANLLIQSELIPIGRLERNEGQIPDVPRNPRLIRDEKYEALKKSITDDPEMLGFREIVAYPYGGKLIVVDGNMRTLALQELGYTNAPVKILPVETSAKKLRGYVMKDNYSYGENDQSILAEDWDMDELEEWGMDDIIAFDIEEETEDDAEDLDEFTTNPYAQVTDSPIYQITGICPTIEQLIDTSKVEELIKKIQASNLSDEVKSMLIACSWRHARINFGLMAEYYAHADKELQELMEDNALVIIDFNRAIENGFAVLRKDLLEIYNKNNAENV